MRRWLLTLVAVAGFAGQAAAAESRLDEDRVIVVSVLDNRGGVQATMYLEPIGDDPGTTRYTCATGDLKDVEHFFPQSRYNPTL